MEVTSEVASGFVPAYNGTPFVLDGDIYKLVLNVADASQAITTSDIIVVEGTPEQTYGNADITQNSLVTVANALAILDMACGNFIFDTTKIPMAAWLSADLNKDGVVTTQDAYIALAAVV